MLCTVVTTTWDSMDVLPSFLAHYRRLGARRVLAMDYDSTDGTRDLLRSSMSQGFIQLVPFPGLASLDASNSMLAIARRTAEPDEWCLFCDPDELLVLPSMKFADFPPGGIGEELEHVTLPRYNMTGARSLLDGSCDLDRHAIRVLTLRVARRTERNVSRDMHATTLEPPWIFTNVLPKVLVRADAALAIGEGDHTARTRKGTSATIFNGACVLHYPFRSYGRFQDKVSRARRDYAANPQLQEGFGWQVRRWMRLDEQGQLRNEYREQFVASDQVDQLLASGTLVHDETLRRFHGGDPSACC